MLSFADCCWQMVFGMPSLLYRSGPMFRIEFANYGDFDYN